MTPLPRLDEIANLQFRVSEMQKRLDELDGRPLARKEVSSRPARIRQAIQEAADEAGILYAQVVGKSHVRHVVTAKRAAIVKLRGMGYSSPQVGRWMGMHHSTVLHHEKQSALLAKEGK